MNPASGEWVHYQNIRDAALDCEGLTRRSLEKAGPTLTKGHLVLLQSEAGARHYALRGFVDPKPPLSEAVVFGRAPYDLPSSDSSDFEPDDGAAPAAKRPRVV
jgi:hypothetical protein